MICSNCGNIIPDKSLICSICGQKPEKEPEPVTPKEVWTMNLVRCNPVPRKNDRKEIIDIPSSRCKYVGIRNDELVIYSQGVQFDPNQSLLGMVADRLLESCILTNEFSWEEIKCIYFRKRNLFRDPLVVIMKDDTILELYMDHERGDFIRNWFEKKKSSTIQK